MKIYGIVSQETWESPSVWQPYYFKHEDAVKTLLKQVEEANRGLNEIDKFKPLEGHPLYFLGKNESLSIEEFEVI